YDHGDDYRHEHEDDRRTGAQKNREVEQRVGQLHQYLPRGDRRVTRAAARAQDQKAEDRKVVIPADRRIAVRTMASRKNDRFAARITMDDDVEETADDRAESERVEGKKEHSGMLNVEC